MPVLSFNAGRAVRPFQMMVLMGGGLPRPSVPVNSSTVSKAAVSIFVKDGGKMAPMSLLQKKKAASPIWVKLGHNDRSREGRAVALTLLA